MPSSVSFNTASHTGNGAPLSDHKRRQLLYRALDALLEPDSVIEVRIPKAKVRPEPKLFLATVAGFFDTNHVEDLVESVMDWDRKAPGLYYTINPVPREMLSLVNNRLIQAGKDTLTRDDHILHRRCLPFDGDPVRRAGRIALPSDISTTDAEKEAGRLGMVALWGYLKELGWPEPIFVDSGNGFYLQYRIDVPTKDDQLVERCVKAAGLLHLRDVFDGQALQIDERTFNPSRVLKIPYTFACKGDATEERPHRLCTVITQPTVWEPVPRELLEQLASEYEPLLAQKTELLRKRAGISAGPPPGKSKTAPGTSRLKERWRAEADQAVLERARAYIAKLPPSISGDGGHGALFKVAMVCINDFGLSDGVALDLLREYNARPDGDPEEEKQLHHKIAGARKKVDQDGGPSRSKLVSPVAQPAASTGQGANAGPAPTGAGIKSTKRPQILIDDKDPRRGYLAARKATLKALRAYNKRKPRIFQRGGALARVGEADTLKVIEELRPEMLNGAMMEAADYGRMSRNTDFKTGKTKVTVHLDMPKERLVKDLLYLPRWPEICIPTIRKVIEAPRYTATGQLVSQPGFDRASGMFLSPPPGFVLPAIPPEPTDAEVSWARAMVFEELYGDVPFARLEEYKDQDIQDKDTEGRPTDIFYNNANRCHILSWMLLPFVIEMIHGPTPLHVAEAPVQRTGKSRTMKLAGIPSLGKLVPISTGPVKEDDWEKVILTQLRYGKEFVLIDNFTGVLSSDALSAVLTSTEFEGRLLVTNKLGIYPNRATWGLTLNNGTYTKDMEDRIVLIRLDAEMAEPSARTGFKYPELDKWAMAHRADLLRACLILCNRWIAEGMVPAQSRYDYPEWVGVMGGILKAIGMSGFLGNRQLLRTDEDKRWIRLIRKWIESVTKTGDGIDHIMYSQDLYALIQDDLREDFVDLGRSGEGNDDWRKRSLRTKLDALRDRVFNVDGVDYRVRVDLSGHHKYTLVQVPLRTQQVANGGI